ncbi:MAG: biopolymer transporter ExbD [Puniceicoccaceae bacterium]|nr:MAG: biopolymer transporter ExbD [Puniceicoccaceae bacterium]
MSESIDMHYRKRRNKKLSINIIPLVDVLTVLLFFFLVTMQFKPFKVLNLNLPEIKTAGQNRMDESLLIALDVEGEIYFNGARVSLAQLSDALEQARDLSLEAPVLIMADERIELKLITEVMDICRSQKFEQIRLQSR